MSFIGNEEQIRFLQDRFKYIYGILFIGIGVLLSRMFFLQMINGDQMRQYSEETELNGLKFQLPEE